MPEPGVLRKTSIHWPRRAPETRLHHEHRACISSEKRFSSTATLASCVSPEPALRTGGCLRLTFLANPHNYFSAFLFTPFGGPSQSLMQAICQIQRLMRPKSTLPALVPSKPFLTTLETARDQPYLPFMTLEPHVLTELGRPNSSAPALYSIRDPAGVGQFDPTFIPAFVDQRPPTVGFPPRPRPG